MDELEKVFIVFDETENYYGFISIGDIQEIINNKPLNPLYEAMRRNVKVATIRFIFIIKKMMIVPRMELCPVVNKENEITVVYFWEDIFTRKKPKVKFDLQL